MQNDMIENFMGMSLEASINNKPSWRQWILTEYKKLDTAHMVWQALDPGDLEYDKEPYLNLFIVWILLNEYGY